jgi:flagellar biosynthesis/type III secretory pathway protein FliH
MQTAEINVNALDAALTLLFGPKASEMVNMAYKALDLASAEGFTEGYSYANNAAYNTGHDEGSAEGYASGYMQAMKTVRGEAEQPVQYDLFTDDYDPCGYKGP